MKKRSFPYICVNCVQTIFRYLPTLFTSNIIIEHMHCSASLFYVEINFARDIVMGTSTLDILHCPRLHLPPSIYRSFLPFFFFLGGGSVCVCVGGWGWWNAKICKNCLVSFIRASISILFLGHGQENILWCSVILKSILAFRIRKICAEERPSAVQSGSSRTGDGLKVVKRTIPKFVCVWGGGDGKAPIFCITKRKAKIHRKRNNFKNKRSCLAASQKWKNKWHQSLKIPFLWGRFYLKIFWFCRIIQISWR